MLRIVIGIIVIVLNTGTYFAFMFPVYLEFLGRHKVVVIFAVVLAFFGLSIIFKNQEIQVARMSFFLFMIYLIGYTFYNFFFSLFIETPEVSVMPVFKSITLNILVPLFTIIATVVQLFFLIKISY